jgi:hypothetical protein
MSERSLLDSYEAQSQSLSKRYNSHLALLPIPNSCRPTENRYSTCGLHSTSMRLEHREPILPLSGSVVLSI